MLIYTLFTTNDRAMEYASPSVLAPFSGLTLVWIVLFSGCVIGEYPLPQQVFAAFLIILGEVIIAVYGDHTNNESVSSYVDVEKSYKSPLFIFYFMCLALWMSGLIIVTLILPTDRIRPDVLRFCWGVSGGSITGLQNFLKDSLTILKLSSSMGYYPWYLFIFMLGGISSAFIGLLFLTACMKRYDATYSSSMFVGSFVISASIMAAVHYNTFQHLDGKNIFLYPLGLFVLLCGVIMLSLIPDDSKDEASPHSTNQHKSVEITGPFSQHANNKERIDAEIAETGNNANKNSVSTSSKKVRSNYNAITY